MELYKDYEYEVGEVNKIGKGKIFRVTQSNKKSKKSFSITNTSATRTRWCRAS